MRSSRTDARPKPSPVRSMASGLAGPRAGPIRAAGREKLSGAPSRRGRPASADRAPLSPPDPGSGDGAPDGGGEASRPPCGKGPEAPATAFARGCLPRGRAERRGAPARTGTSPSSPRERRVAGRPPRARPNALFGRMNSERVECEASIRRSEKRRTASQDRSFVRPGAVAGEVDPAHGRTRRVAKRKRDHGKAEPIPRGRRRLWPSGLTEPPDGVSIPGSSRVLREEPVSTSPRRTSAADGCSPALAERRSPPVDRRTAGRAPSPRPCA